MFWRKKKIAFRDWALIALFSDAAESPHFETLMAKVMALESMKLGIAVGAQFPTKAMPIHMQVKGTTENAYAQMIGSLQVWLDSVSEEAVELDSFPWIVGMEESLESQGVNGLTLSQTIEWASMTFAYGLLMGSRHRELSLKALEASILNENLGWELVKEYAPPDLKSEPEPTYKGFLAAAREMVAKYEKEHGALS